MADREVFNMTARTRNHTVAAAAPVEHSPWHSPVPYLFGGLAAMLGLIAFALLILACSYWKLSGYLESGDRTGGEDPSRERDVEAGKAEDDGEGGETAKAKAVQEKFLVIMAGQEMPTYLATRVSNSGRSSSFVECRKCTCSSGDQESDEDDGDAGRRKKEESDGQQVSGGGP